MALIRRYKSNIYGDYWKGIFQYGFYMGLILSFVILFRYWIIMPLSQPVSYVENGVMLVFTVLFVWLYRKNLEGGKMTLKEGYMVGLGSGIVASIVYAIFMMVYAQYIDPDIQNRSFEIQRELKENEAFSDAQLREWTKPSFLAMSAFMLSGIMAIIWGLIAAILIRNERAVVSTKESRKMEKEIKKEGKQNKNK